MRLPLGQLFLRSDGENIGLSLVVGSTWHERAQLSKTKCSFCLTTKRSLRFYVSVMLTLHLL